MSKKKKVLFQSDFALAKTGFGRCMKALLTYLYKTGKYDIVHYCCGVNFSNGALTKTPWKSRGCLPDSQQELEALNKDSNVAQKAGYGASFLDNVIIEEKPDVYIATQDFWGVDFAIDKPWYNKIPCVIWTTLDSLPLLPAAVEKAPKIVNYWVWSNFAEKELHRLGFKQVRTVHGALDDKNFFKVPLSQRKDLRARFGLDNDFVVGFVFRNQLRKSVPNLLEGFKMFKTQNPQAKKARLLLHTSFTEGWQILRLAKEYQIDPNDILTTYVCHACGGYEVKVYTGEDQNCKYCNSAKSQHTTNVGRGVTESQLNEIYNLMDVYCHPFTSGGQEIPVQEAKLTELITLVTNYSCGEELCEEGSNSIPLEWSEYREHGTEFRKASTYPASIAKKLNLVFEMDVQKRGEMGRKAREWTIKNFSINTIGKIFEDFLDSAEVTNYDFNTKEPEKNPNAQVPHVEDNSQWLIQLYKLILNMEVNNLDTGYLYWMDEFKRGATRDVIENHFRQVALKHNQEHTKFEFKDLLDKNDDGKRILYIIPESIGDVYLSTSLFESLKKVYPEYNLYVATKPENLEVLEGNPHIHRILNYVPEMDNHFWLTGIGGHPGYFRLAFHPYFGTQRMIDYVNNGQTRIALNLNSHA